ncbi:hypothetical protein [Neorhodopirellula lusitana]|uniref:hypothetical protein n=1 Tax=Neorhodopirellula lusitana TaxID=445327 RepID=UPI00384E825C
MSKRTNVSQRTNDLLSDWLDDADGNPGSEQNLSADGVCESVADSLLVHGLLADIGHRDAEHDARQIQALMKRIDLESKSEPDAVLDPSESSGRGRFAVISSALALAAAVMVMFAVVGPQQRVSAAMASLEKVVEAALKPLDRTYRVRVLEEYSPDKRPRNLSQTAWDRKSPKQIDGATIYVRGANEYVMTVLLAQGGTRTSGCDGRYSWSFREDGPVHVTEDLNRFRGGMPGGQHDMPFLNIHAHLSQLKVGYDVELIDLQESTADSVSLSQLNCARKSNDVRGTKWVKIWFDPKNGTVHKMMLDGLPRGRGGPKSVMLELIDQSDLGQDFFSHDSHHLPERKVRFE